MRTHYYRLVQDAHELPPAPTYQPHTAGTNRLPTTCLQHDVPPFRPLRVYQSLPEVCVYAQMSLNGLSSGFTSLVRTWPWSAPPARARWGVCARPKPPPGHLRARTEAPEGATRYTPKLAIQELNSITSSRSFNEHQPPDPLAREVPDSPARNAAEGAQGRNTTKASSLAALHGTGRCVHTEAHR